MMTPTDRFAHRPRKPCKPTALFRFARGPLKGAAPVQTVAMQASVQTNPKGTP